ncbi:hypothetical protein YC2023_110867 [Brassica napus]
MRKEVALARKKIDFEREYKEALEAFNEKNREKVQLITKLTDILIKTDYILKQME